MASRARPARSAVPPRKFEDDSDGDQEDGAFTDVCLMDNPYVPGEVVEVKFRGVDPSIPVGSKEWKKEKRLADNRASAARSRAMERLKKNALEAQLQVLAAENARLAAENAKLQAQLQAAGNKPVGSASVARSGSIDRRSEVTKSPPLTASDAADAQSISGSSFTASMRGDFSDSASTRSASSAEAPSARRPVAVRPAPAALPVLHEETAARPWTSTGSNLIPGLLGVEEEEDGSLFSPSLHHGHGLGLGLVGAQGGGAPTAPGMAQYGGAGLGLGMGLEMVDDLDSGLPPFFPSPAPPAPATTTTTTTTARTTSSSLGKRERAGSMDSMASSAMAMQAAATSSSASYTSDPATHDMESERSSSPMSSSLPPPSPAPLLAHQAGAGAATPAGNKRTRRGSGGASGGGHALPLPASLALCLGMALCLTMGPSPTTLGPGHTGGEDYGYLPADMDDVGRAGGEGAGHGYEYRHGSAYGRATYILPESFSVTGEGISATGAAGQAEAGDEEEGRGSAAPQSITASAGTSAPPATPIPSRAPVNPRKLPLAASMSGWALPPPGAMVANVLMKLLPAKGAREEGNASAAPQTAGNDTSAAAGADEPSLPLSSPPSTLLSDMMSWLPSLPTPFPPPFLTATPASTRPHDTAASHQAAAHALAILDPWLEPSLWPAPRVPPASPLGRLCIPVQPPPRHTVPQAQGMDKAVALPASSSSGGTALALPAPGQAAPRSLSAAEERSLATLADLLRAHHQEAEQARGQQGALPALPAPQGAAQATTAPVVPAVTLPAPGTSAEAELQAAIAVALPALAARAGISTAHLARVKLAMGAAAAGGAVTPVLCIDRPAPVPAPDVQAGGAQAAACLAFLLAASGLALPASMPVGSEGPKDGEAEEDVEQGLNKANKRARLVEGPALVSAA